MLIWSDEYLTNNEEVDGFHKQVFDEIEDLYNKLDDTKKYNNEITELTDKLAEKMIKHLDSEIEYFQNEGISDLDEHIKSHAYYKKEIGSYDKHFLPPAIRSILIIEIIKDYMQNHFLAFDAEAINKIKLKNINLSEL